MASYINCFSFLFGDFFYKQCRGLAAAIFNNESKYTPIRTGGSDPYKMLYDEDVDIATSAIRIKMDNDVYQVS